MFLFSGKVPIAAQKVCSLGLGWGTCRSWKGLFSFSPWSKQPGSPQELSDGVFTMGVIHVRILQNPSLPSPDTALLGLYNLVGWSLSPDISCHSYSSQWLFPKECPCWQWEQDERGWTPSLQDSGRWAPMFPHSVPTLPLTSSVVWALKRRQCPPLRLKGELNAML